MNLTNTTKFPAAATLGMDSEGRELLVVVVKGTFGFPEEGDDVVRAKEQRPLVDADLYTGDPGLSAPLYESDFAARKLRCDVLLNGSAYAPGGKAAAIVPVLLQVGSMSKSFNVVGARAWVKDVFSWKSTRPLPFVKMPVSYNNAFGGRDLSDPDEKKHRWHRSNPVGVGFHTNLYPPLVEGKPLPNTEEIGRPVDRPEESYRPMAFGPVGRAWDGRYQLAGTYDQRWSDEVCPFLPSDFQDAYYQCAPSDQQIPFPAGGESVLLVNLTPQGRTSFRLPRIELPVQILDRVGALTELRPNLDTLLLEPDERRILLTWRATLPLRKNLLELDRVLVGRLSRGWHKARESGRTYAPSLAEAVSLRRPPGGE